MKLLFRAAGALALLALAPSACERDTRIGASAQAGAERYADTCALCHGARGEGYAADEATALANPTFLASASDAYLRRSIERGRPGTTMSAWGQKLGGPYDAEALDDLVALLRSWQTAPSATLPTLGPGADSTRGATTYAAKCAECHGATGNEGPQVRLANAELLAVASDGFLKYAIQKGRPGTTMRPFEGELTASEIDDVVALLRSWTKPVSDGDVPIPGTLGPIVLNPDGPEPAFTLGTRYTPADVIKAELDNGASFGFLDARAPSDYVAGHIAGASDVPFYEADQFVSVLPKDKWLVCYCACPHAESGRLADTLFASGFTKVTILDEGYFTWRDRGYPIRTGPAP